MEKVYLSERPRVSKAAAVFVFFGGKIPRTPNMLVFHTMVYQTKAVNKLRGQDIEITNEILAGISPYWTEHLNRFGMFQLDMEKSAAEIEYDLIDSEI
jgi:hypothetical protein